MEYYLFDIGKPLHFCSAGKCNMPENWIHYERKKNEFILYVIIDGSFYLKTDDVKQELKKGDVFLMKPNVHHIGYRPAAVKFFWLHFTMDETIFLNQKQAEEFIRLTPEDKIILPEKFTLKKIENFVTLINQIIHFFKKEDVKIPKFLATALLIDLSNQFSSEKEKNQENTPAKRRFDEIVAYIDANYGENLSITNLAEMFDYNKVYLNKLFKKYLHVTLKEYIIDSKLRASEFLLLSSTDTIAAIAHECGFTNEFYFMKLFKKKYGFTPTTYRNNYHLQVYTRY